MLLENLQGPAVIEESSSASPTDRAGANTTAPTTALSTAWPKTLHPAQGPFRTDKLIGAAAGMGQWGEQTCLLADEGWVPPDVMTGLTLFILSHQPRDPNKTPKIPGGGGGVAGGVWVRERFTIYEPLQRDDVFRVQGAAVGRHVHKGRRYGTNRCETFNAAGRQVAANLTTGLLQYKVQEGLDDRVEGQAPDAIAVPGPDWSNAGTNPSLESLKNLAAGTELGGDPLTLGLDLMQARDTKKPDNPIHSDPELARKAGLTKPIAGGSHVLSFVLEVILKKIGRHGLYYGSAFDIRWKTPVYADLVMTPSVSVVRADAKQVEFALRATLESGASAMEGQVVVPLV